MLTFCLYGVSLNLAHLNQTIYFHSIHERFLHWVCNNTQWWPIGYHSDNIFNYLIPPNEYLLSAIRFWDVSICLSFNFLSVPPPIFWHKNIFFRFLALSLSFIHQCKCFFHDVSTYVKSKTHNLPELCGNQGGNIKIRAHLHEHVIELYAVLYSCDVYSFFFSNFLRFFSSYIYNTMLQKTLTIKTIINNLKIL